MSRSSSLFCLPLTATLWLSMVQTASAADIDTVKSRMLADAVNNAGFRAQTEPYYGTDFAQAQTYLSSIGSNGSWSDIAYSDTTNTWPALKHLDRMLIFAYVYNKDGHALFKSAAVLSALNSALGYWYQVNPTCTNWFKNDIAKQFYLGPIGLLMQGVVNASYLTNIVNDLTAAPSMTGANKTMLSTSVIYRSVLEGNASRLATGVSGVTSAIVLTAGDGIQRDNSFQQHGGILYNGNYGFSFLRDVTFVAEMVAGTQYALSASQVGLLRDNYLESTRWMIRNAVLDYSVRGREVGSTGGTSPNADIFLPILDHMSVVDSANQAAYQASKNAIVSSAPQSVSGTRHFWNSDYTSVQRPGYFTSLKMCSRRTIGMERNVNTENLMGYWLPYGLTYTYRRGDEFDYIFPVWDWARLPGVTNPHVEISWADNATTYTSQTTAFVGGASDGSYAASAMDFSLEQTTAKKSWFWFDEEWVALGAGIQSTHARPVFTSVQQVLMKGAVVADGAAFSGAAKALTNPKWVFHDGIGYVFPENQSVQIQAAAQTGSVRRIFGLGSAASVSADVFSLWFDHGTAPSNKTYQYIVVPGVEQAAVDAYSKSIPVAVLSNTSSIQAVTQKNRRITGAVFFQAGSVSVPSGPSVQVDSPSVVVLNEPSGTIAVSNPSGTATRVTLTVTNVSGAMKSQAITLPTGDNAGKSVLVADLLEKRPALDGGPGGGTGGAPGTGGAAAGGAPSNAGNGGASAAGTSGSVAGNTSMGGASAGGTSTGGSNAGGSATGGASVVSGGGTSQGGATATGGASTAGKAGASNPDEGPDSSGCGCSTPGESTKNTGGMLLGMVALCGAALLRRRAPR